MRGDIHKMRVPHTTGRHSHQMYNKKINKKSNLDLSAHWLYFEIIPDVRQHLHLIHDLVNHVMLFLTEIANKKQSEFNFIRFSEIHQSQFYLIGNFERKIC